ncbi:uncharacterized protein LOC125686119 isoform X5 [Lagopus muta]|uniref:uncharacterized protein LOC125686119 isoform X1 n=1 Tax=Lagopus muta TaxID=64668 RepID=UPI00209D4904|nr:uncharacterized protein LOC125686119 isoform X1 [Lagopus muta]XP_048785734.1 uncharacterized protein LOC125686119 isoform X4 [Lagopus muta]XP_048785735.1 uncharacterized protein LOC125686119 isoform X5 [Lagopus muta]
MALCAACASPKRFPCGRRERMKEAEGPFLGAGSSVASCLPERRAARWAQGVPSSCRPVPCPAAPSSCYVERHGQQCGCHFRTFAASQPSPWSPLPRPTHSPLRALAAMSGAKRARGEACPISNRKGELGAPEAKRRRGAAFKIKRRRKEKRVRFHRAWTSAVTTSVEPMEVDPPLDEPMEVDPPPDEPMEVDPPPDEPMEVDPPAAQLAWHHTTVPGPASAPSHRRWSRRSAPYPLRGPRPQH